METNLLALVESVGTTGGALLASSLMHANAEPYGDSVRLEKLKLGGNYQEPPHLYLIYIGLDRNDPAEGLYVRQYSKDINPALIEQEENGLIAKAIADDPLHRVGKNFELIKFEQASFLTIVLDEDAWAFYYPEPNNPEPDFEGTHDPIVFTMQKTFIAESGARISRPVVRNRSFYDLETITKTIPDRDGVDQVRDGIRCINFFTKSADGDPIEPEETLDYTFNIFLRVPFSKTVQQKVIIIIDPDGQNQGPPGVGEGMAEELPALVATEFAE